MTRGSLIAVCLAVGPGATLGAPQGPAAGSREIVALDLITTAPGGAPAGLRLLRGAVQVVLKDGTRMLKASSPSEFLLTLPEVLPQDFTLEFDIVPKECCNPEDLAFEGTATLSQSSSSAQVLWHPDAQSVIGGGVVYQSAMPADLRESTRGQLTHIVVSFEGETFKLYTNGRRLYTLTQRRLVRGRVLRVFLGGQDEDEQAVYLARLRIAAGAYAGEVPFRRFWSEGGDVLLPGYLLGALGYSGCGEQ